MLIGHRMKAIRQQAGMTLKDLSAATGISVQDLSAFERNQTNARATKAFAIANALHTTIADLIGDTPQMTGMDTCAYCGIQYHPMLRYSNGERVICVCEAVMWDIIGRSPYPGCSDQAEADGYYARPKMTPKR